MCLNSLPLQAQLGLFFLFCLSSVSLDSPLSERRLYSFLSSGVFRLPWIRPQLPHPAPTGPVTRLAGVVSPTRPPKPHTRLHRAEFWFSLQNEVTPPPKGGRAGFYSTWSCSASLGSCLWQLLVTNGSHWLNRAGLGLRWCRSPTRPPTPHTGPHRAEFGVYHFFLERFCPGRTAKSRSSL